MSTQSTQAATSGSATPPVGATDPGVTPTPTVTHHQQLAMEFLKGFRELVKIIPNVEVPHPSTKAFVDSHKSIREPFLTTAIVAVENDPALKVVEKLDANDSRDVLQYKDAYKEVVAEVMQYATNLDFTIDHRVAKFGVNALQVYSIAKALARDSSAGVTAVHAANLKRELKRTGGRPKGSKKQKTPTSPGTPAPKEDKSA